MPEQIDHEDEGLQCQDDADDACCCHMPGESDGEAREDEHDCCACCW